jgi:hypothetical protein
MGKQFGKASLGKMEEGETGTIVEIVEKIIDCWI